MVESVAQKHAETRNLNPAFGDDVGFSCTWMGESTVTPRMRMRLYFSGKFKPPTAVLVTVYQQFRTRYDE